MLDEHPEIRAIGFLRIAESGQSQPGRDHLGLIREPSGRVGGGHAAQAIVEKTLDWRSNVLLRSSDRNLSTGEDDGEITVIPTAGIAVGARQYLGYMSVRHWADPGQWDTNLAGIGSEPFQMAAFAAPIVTGPVGELSVRYDAFAHSWLMTYLNEHEASIVLRHSSSPLSTADSCTRGRPGRTCTS